MKKISLITLCFVLLFGFASLAYAELPANRIALGVQLGATVSQGDPIGAIGCTGYAYGNHLHFDCPGQSKQ